MTGRSFVDTNVLVYAVDGRDPAKQAAARAVLGRSPMVDLVLSAQVLGEFYVTVTHKLDRPVKRAVARQMVEQLRRLPVVAIGADDVASAVERSQAWGISYWDALIITSAITAGCDRVLSEDLGDGVSYGSVLVENPFRSDRRVSEAAKPAYERLTRGGRWTDDELWQALARYERACTDAGMKPKAVHSYWDYARRFLDWRTGNYHPRGTPWSGRPAPAAAASLLDLFEQVQTYTAMIEGAGRQQATIDTYNRHAMFFLRWLAGDFEPGRRLRPAVRRHRTP